MNILVTGGAGYIGSHTCLALLQAGFQVTVIDNLVNSKEESLRRVQKLCGKPLIFHKIDLLDHQGLDTVFQSSRFDAVIHFAALKAPGESVKEPLRYYNNNLTGSLHLFSLMVKHGVKNIVFSSSATVYGDPQSVPIFENFPCDRQVNPYGRTKRMNEIMLEDLYTADPSWNIAILRYFNPVGAHPSGQIGEDPEGIPGNLMPYIAQVAVGRRPYLRIWGGDYATPDGTGVRDYIHVVDLADGHIKALDKLNQNPGLVIYNLGSKKGFSVLDIVGAFEKASNRKIPYKICERRPGDIAISLADLSKAKYELGWSTQRDMDVICEDSWRWQSQNPKGYE